MVREQAEEKMKPRKPKTNEPSPRIRLAADFVKAIEAQWRLHGTDILDAARKENPTKFAELIARLVPQEPLPTGPFDNAQNMEDIGRGLLRAIGVDDDLMTDDMIREAVEANNTFVDRLQAICAAQKSGMN
jgi:hypothetical protein